MQVAVAAEMKMELKDLLKLWNGGYNPVGHFFIRKIDKETTIPVLDPIWFLDPIIWKMLIEAYAKWFSIELNTVYTDLYRVLYYVPDFYKSENEKFKTWIIGILYCSPGNNL